MLDGDDLLNSDDDEFLLEASNCQFESNLDDSQVLNNTTENQVISTNKESKEITTVDKLLSLECYTPKNNAVTRSVLEKDFNSPVSVKKHTTGDNSLYIDNRFTPGFTPTAKKRKLPGPAGFLSEPLGKLTNGKCSNESSSLSFFDEDVPSSQFCSENLSLLSWKKLQTAVSSCSNLNATAKYYSIRRILQESSKKKPPKHMVVPILCVLLKKISSEKSSSVSIFMDDTGDINGKIESEVFSLHKNYLVEGSAVILKKVTFLCNMLMLKPETLVTIYHPDGSEKHLQKLESVLETSEPLRPLDCGCLKMSNTSLNPNNHKTGCINYTKTHSVPTKPEAATDKEELFQKKPTPKISFTKNESFEMRNDNFLEDLLSEDNFMDEFADDFGATDDFDKVLSNLDEKSFETV